MVNFGLGCSSPLSTTKNNLHFDMFDELVIKLDRSSIRNYSHHKTFLQFFLL